jgi:aminopeptidase N
MILAALVLSLVGCPHNDDLTLPPPSVHPSFKVEVPPPLETGRLPPGVEPEAYDLALTIDPAADTFSGEVKIRVSIARPLGAIVLHAAEITVESATIVSRGRPVQAEARLRKAAGATKEKEELVLIASQEIAPGEAEIIIRYSAPLKAQLRGIYAVKHDGESFVFTQFEPSDARRMLPCFDDPKFKVPFDVRVTVPKGNLVFSNAPRSKITRHAESVSFQFATTKPIPSYLLALAIGPLEVRQGPTEPTNIRIITTKGKTKHGDYALQAAAEQLAILNAYLGIPYPYQKLDLVAVPNFGAGAMENPGLVTFREELLLIDRGASALHKRRVAMVMAHELVHQWFGNLVTMPWWDDLWLNEGFATYLETVVVDRWRPAMRADLSLLGWSAHAMDIDSLHAARAVRQPVANTYQAKEAFDGITYLKGAAVISMLEQWLGEDAFRRGLQQYMKDFSWKTATASELFGALSTSANKDVARVAASFVDVTGVPLVRAELSCVAGQAPTVKLSQQRYEPRLVTKPSADLWVIPVCLEYAAPGRRSKVVKHCGLMEGRTASFELQTKRCPAWLLPNAGYRGYYRYTMPAKQLEAVRRASVRRGARSKAGFLANLWALTRASEIGVGELMTTMVQLKSSKERQVIDQIVTTLGHLRPLVDDASRARFAAFVKSLLLRRAKRLGFDRRPGDSKDVELMRRTVFLALATMTDDPWIAGQARKRAAAFLADSTAVDADAATVALMMATRLGWVRFEQLTTALSQAKTPQARMAVMTALGSFVDPALVRRSLNLILDGTVRSQDAVYLFRGAIKQPQSRDAAVAWLHEHFAELLKRFPGMGAGRSLRMVAAQCDAGARAKAVEVLSPIVEKHGLTRRFDEAIERIELCVDFKQRQGGAVSRFLSRRRGW